MTRDRQSSSGRPWSTKICGSNFKAGNSLRFSFTASFRPKGSVAFGWVSGFGGWLVWLLVVVGPVTLGSVLQ